MSASDEVGSGVFAAPPVVAVAGRSLALVNDCIGLRLLDYGRQNTEGKTQEGISSTKRNARLLSARSRKPQMPSIIPYPDTPPPLSTQHLLATSECRRQKRSRWCVWDAESAWVSPIHFESRSVVFRALARRVWHCESWKGRQTTQAAIKAHRALLNKRRPPQNITKKRSKKHTQPLPELRSIFPTARRV